jgi:hypothetical protein
LEQVSWLQAGADARWSKEGFTRHHAHWRVGCDGIQRQLLRKTLEEAPMGFLIHTTSLPFCGVVSLDHRLGLRNHSFLSLQLSLLACVGSTSALEAK